VSEFHDRTTVAAERLDLTDFPEILDDLCQRASEESWTYTRFTCKLLEEEGGIGCVSSRRVHGRRHRLHQLSRRYPPLRFTGPPYDCQQLSDFFRYGSITLYLCIFIHY